MNGILCARLNGEKQAKKSDGPLVAARPWSLSCGSSTDRPVLSGLHQSRTAYSAWKKRSTGSTQEATETVLQDLVRGTSARPHKPMQWIRLPASKKTRMLQALSAYPGGHRYPIVRGHRQRRMYQSFEGEQYCWYRFMDWRIIGIFPINIICTASYERRVHVS